MVSALPKLTEKLMKPVRIALITLAAILIASAAQSEPLKFNGTLLSQVSSAQSTVSFRSQNDLEFVETVTIRSIEPDGNFNDVSRAFIARAKTESGGARLRVMEKSATQELMVVYLKELKSDMMLYRVERLSAPNGALPISISYSATFELGDTSDEQDAKIEISAIEAIAKYDMNHARTLLKPSI